MRIVAGTLGGRVVRAPRGMDTRPTSDRVREALFDILAPRINGASFLDLYAGTGAVGIEAASRGAGRVCFVESRRKAMDVLKENLRTLGVEAKALIVDARRTPDILVADGPFDIIFADPPYRQADEAVALFDRLCDAGLLAMDGLAVLEYGLDRPAPGEPKSLAECDRRRYGQSALAFYSNGMTTRG